MRLVFLYGPPASGKLTVAQELANLTGFRLFHNHLTIDWAKTIMPESSPERAALINKLRLCVMETASEAHIDLLFTFVCKTTGDDKFITQVINTVERKGGEVCFVHLIPPLPVLEKRLKEESRRAYSKIKEFDQLQKLMAKQDIYTPIKHKNTLTIDNSDTSARDVALEVIRYFALECVHGIGGRR